jgi:Tfp pilus assembly protein FimT
MQFELARGAAIVHGYRLEHVNDSPFGQWALTGSNNGEEWTVIDRRNEPVGTQRVRVCHCQAAIAFKFFRLVYEVQEVQGTPKLRVRHFEIFGIYLDIPRE